MTVELLAPLHHAHTPASAPRLATPLRRARAVKGWSQARAVEVLTQTARGWGWALCTPESLRRQLKRWESGQSRPDASYRQLLISVYRCSEGDLWPESTGIRRPLPLAANPDVVAPRRGIDPYGEADSFEQEPRVAVALTMHLSFANLMGLLVAYPYDCVVGDDELGDDAAVREAVLYAFAEATMRNLEDWSRQAMAIYANPRAHDTLGTRALICAVAIQRVFGVSAPAPIAEPVHI
jgi:transcriptional regulator with XRE-family HTH domain